MLVFVDESGDTGRKVGAGSSELFTIVLVYFEDENEAQATDDRISMLRRELNKPANFEFHFQDNSDQIRQAFFEAVVPFNFFYLGFVINKAMLYAEAFSTKNLFYNWVCGTVFENAKPYLDNAKVKTDSCGNREFQRLLAAYLKQRINDRNATVCHIKKVTPQDSRTNNLLQLADMVCGAVARSYRADRKLPEHFRKIIKHREISVRFWPE